MLQIDHIYEFLYQNLFNDFELASLANGVPKLEKIIWSDFIIFTRDYDVKEKILFYDQEPVIPSIAVPYMDMYRIDPNLTLKILVSSEHSQKFDQLCIDHNFKKLYYFFHGFAALDWYRGYYALNYSRSIVKNYAYDYITFNRIINNDRSYRIYLISKLKQFNLLDKGLVSFAVTDDKISSWQEELVNPDSKLSEKAKQHISDNLVGINQLVIDNSQIAGSASANIVRTIVGAKADNLDAFWHIVTETVFYYEKLHLTEKIFKPIVSKQAFMLLGAPGNLAYLRSYGFKTFGSVIDETYDTIQDNDARIEAVVEQLNWYCSLSPQDKLNIIKDLEPIIQHNFDHFYGEFRHIITEELLDNSKALFTDIGYDDSQIKYTDIYHVLTS